MQKREQQRKKSTTNEKESGKRECTTKEEEEQQFFEYECIGHNLWEPPIPPHIHSRANSQVIALSRHLRVYAPGSSEWDAARRLRVTASAIGEVVNCGYHSFQNPIPAYRHSELQMLEKSGFAEQFTGSDATRHGQAMEPEARAHYSRSVSREHMARFGLLVHPRYWFLGASPDGVGMHSGRLVEIKCPASRSVVQGNKIPAHYWMQMQLQEEICESEQCHYFEYKKMKRPAGEKRTNFVTVHRSREWFAAVLPLLQQYIVHLYRLKALARLFRPARMTETGPK